MECSNKHVIDFKQCQQKLNVNRIYGRAVELACKAGLAKKVYMNSLIYISSTHHFNVEPLAIFIFATVLQ